MSWKERAMRGGRRNGPRRGGFLALPLALALLAGCAADVVDPVSHSEAIVGGSRERGYPAVVFLYNVRGAACTASIVAPRLVLTAKHCVQLGGSVAPASSFRVYVGDSVRSFTAEYLVQEVRAAPGRADIRDGSDVAVLLLSREVRGLTPLEMSFASPATLPGQEVTSIGYGQRPDGSSGVKYRTTTVANGFDGRRIFVPPAVCQGDSGGPLLGPDGKIYGVASFIYSTTGGSSPRCGTAPGAYNAIAPYRAFLEQAIEDSGQCIDRGEEQCNGRDDDCDGEVDETCTPLGEACAADEECVGQLCDETPAGRICTRSCDPLRPDQGCPSGMYCALTGNRGCEGRCVPGAGEGGPKPIGESCSQDIECATLLCLDPGDGRRRCLQACQGDRGMCAAGEACAAIEGSCGGCVDAGLIASGLGMGEPCSADGDCRSGFCFLEDGYDPEAAYCSRRCEDGGCPDGFHCRPMEGGDDVCVRGLREGVGGPCRTNADCAEELACAVLGDRRWCTSPGCSGGCPAGMACVDAGGARVCAPQDAGLLGEPCGEGSPRCTGGNVCASTPQGEVCTRLCGPGSPCPSGFECVRADGRGTNVCLPAPETRPADDGGCCSVVGRRPSPSGVLLALWLLGWLSTRRRRRGVLS